MIAKRAWKWLIGLWRLSRALDRVIARRREFSAAFDKAIGEAEKKYGAKTPLPQREIDRFRLMLRHTLRLKRQHARIYRLVPILGDRYVTRAAAAHPDSPRSD